jgi:hypothetical protein
VNKFVCAGIRTSFAPIVFCAFLATLSACAQQKSAPAVPATHKAPRAPYAGTINVPQRRPVRGEEMTPEIAQRAREILDGYSGAPFGTEVPFEIDGQPYIGRIEEHYHEPGGPRRPWGRHRGVTVYHGE